MKKCFLPAFEIDIVHHCNLRCRACGHFSPYAKRHFVSPKSIQKDLSILKKYFHIGELRLMGGEPLLHPSLLDVVKVAKSGIADKVVLVTNGLLLHSIGDDLWKAIDELVVSVYPKTEGKLSRHFAEFLDKEKKFGVMSQLRYQRSFREVFAGKGTNDTSLIKKIYGTCQNAHVAKCYNINEGFLFKCPQAAFMGRVLKKWGLTQPESDSVKIEDSPEFENKAQKYLNSAEPLWSCRYCLGSAGRRIPHSFVKQEELERRTEDVIDWEFLALLEKDPGASPSFDKPC